MDIKVTWEDAIPDIVRNGAVTGLNRAAERLLALAVERVPVDTGDLRKSGSFHEADRVALEATVTFNTPYAVIVHEGTHMRFQRVKNPNAQAKYLSRPVADKGDELIRVVQASVRRALRS